VVGAQFHLMQSILQLVIKAGGITAFGKSAVRCQKGNTPATLVEKITLITPFQQMTAISHSY
jgi:hypothetical protein